MTAKRRARTGSRPPDLIAAVGELIEDLEPLGCEPTLVGGMALVTLGSRRVTRDFDFLVSGEAREQQPVLEVFYRHGFELVSRMDEAGNVLRTISSRPLAFARLRMDRPKSAHFYNHVLGLQVDLLFDFPLEASAVRRRSTRRTIESHAFHIAGKPDLVVMKEIASGARGLSADLQDLEFLKRT